MKHELFPANDSQPIEQALDQIEESILPEISAMLENLLSVTEAQRTRSMDFAARIGDMTSRLDELAAQIRA